MSDYGSPPAPDVVEVSVLGPGFGESIVLHLPGIGWGVVDGCRHTLDYLRAVAVQSLAFLCLTHPHADHFRGLAEVARAFKGRIDRAWLYSGKSTRELLTLFERQNEHGTGDLHLLREVIQSMKEAATSYRSLGAGKSMIRVEYATARGPVPVEVHALSPSSRDEDYYFELLGRAIPGVGDLVVPFPDRDHNVVSAGLAVLAGPWRIILGSDIESGREAGMGWNGILADRDLPSLGADLVKVSHHGSPTSHADDAWQAHGHPHAAMTPYWRGKTKRPTQQDVERTQGVARTVHVSAKSDGGKPRRHFRAAKKATALKNWRTIDESLGHIRYRMGLADAEVRVEIFGQARECTGPA